MADRIPHARLTRRKLLAASALSLALPSSAIARQTTPGASPVPDGPRLLVSPTSLRYDEAFEVAVDNIEPGTEVTIRSSFIDGRARSWSAEATWVANEYRYIQCAEIPPIHGDFDVADSMAFIWAAKAAGNAYFVPSIYGPNPVTITASIGDQQFDAVTIERTVLPQGSYHEDIAGEGLVASFFSPIAGTPAPAMIVIGGSEGGLNPGVRLVAAQLASQGYATLALAWFGIDPLPPRLESVPLEYFGTAIAWLQAHPDIDPERIGMMGFSRGAEATLLAASRYPELKVAISYAGSGVSFATPGSDPLTPAYTWKGEPLTFPADFSEESLATAIIPVERINGPVVLIAGGGDMLWGIAAPFLSSIAWDRLQQAEHPWPNQFLTYPGAGHGISAPYNPMTFIRDDPVYTYGGNPLDDQVASVNSWRAVLNTLQWRFRDSEGDE